jgi:carboxypeptidase C (cathepsin A)
MRLPDVVVGAAVLAVVAGLGQWAAPASAQAPHAQSAPNPILQDRAPQPETREASPQPPADSVSCHAVEAGGQRLSYKAVAGTLPALGSKGETSANIFYVAYTLDTQSTRPVSFVFNGGPGAASAFLHLAAMGPRGVAFTANGAGPVQPAQITDNPETWLEFTDLVFIDPVGTGYSRSTAAGEEGERAFFSVDKDASVLTEIVRLYLARSERSLAPVFLVGESYGGFRAALLAHRLLQAGVQVKGAVLISPALDFSTLRADAYDPLPLVFDLPSMAASHMERRDGVSGSLDSLREVEAFARGPYLLHLVAGMKRDESIQAALSRYTGLSQEVVARHHGRVSASLFVEEFEKKNERALSRYDGTVSAPAPQPAEQNHYDPILDGATTVLNAAMAQYARQELGYRTDFPYHLLNRKVNEAWDFRMKSMRQGYANALDGLQEARTRNPALRLLVVHGYSDLVTPYAGTQFLIDQLPPIDTASPIVLRVHRGGHMMYLRPDSRRLLKEDAREMFDAALK